MVDFCPECIHIVPVTAARVCSGWKRVEGVRGIGFDCTPSWAGRTKTSSLCVPTFLGPKGFYRPAGSKAGTIITSQSQYLSSTTLHPIMQRRQKTSLKNLLHSGANDRRGGGAAKPVTFQQVLTNGLQRQQAKGLMGQHGLTLGQRRLFLPRLTTTISTSRTCVKLNHKNWTSISIKMNDTLIKGQTSSSFSLLNKMLFYSVLYHN